ncbi:MAG: hypothetical protein NZ602_01585 [Thermoguttaceae bacterium]|nr:hypothetical protein [Thermoguttaceae bacterium]MDW8038384.1 hypothetical protein [Thermoguttaceae bacterium]
MIDRSARRLHFWLRPKTFAMAAALSAAGLLTLPVLAVAVLLLGGIVAGLCFLLLWAMAVLGVLLAVGGLVVAGGGLAQQDGALTGGGLLAGVLGWGLFSLSKYWEEPVGGFATRFWQQSLHATQFLLEEVFLRYHLYFWSLVPIGIAGFLALGTLAAIGILRCHDWINHHWYGICYTCPMCHQRGLPLFRCPGCSQPVSQLQPSPYGLFQAYCAHCQRPLPTVDWLGRSSLPKLCANPACSAELSHPAIGALPELHIGFLGAQSSGKTSLMMVAIWQLARQVAPRYAFQLQWASAQQKDAFEASIRQLAEGVPIRKTAPQPHPPALPLALRFCDSEGILLYLYDAAGEDFMEESTMIGHRFHCFVHGLVLVIDPITEWLAQADPQDKIDPNLLTNVHPATQQVVRIFDPFLCRLEHQRNLPGQKPFPIPLAVVISKTDPALRILGPKLLQKSSSSPVLQPGPQPPGRSTSKHRWTPRQLLLQLGLGNLVMTLENRFQPVCYFATSAVEEVSTSAKDTSATPPADSCRAVRPLLWLLQQAQILPPFVSSPNRANLEFYHW